MKKYKLILCTSLSLVYLLGCSQINPRIKSNNLDSVGILLMKKDPTGTIDTIYSYDESRKLSSKEVFRDSLLNGVSTYYYPNEIPKISSSYSFGHKNGLNIYFDTTGKKLYSDYYYFDLTVGPVIYYDTNGSPQRFFFANLQNETLFYIYYDNWKGIASIHDKIINYVTNSIEEDGKNEIQILMYLPKPPRFNFEYSLFKWNKMLPREYKLVTKLTNQLPFISFRVPILPNQEEYAIGLNVYDSILKKQTLIYKDL